MPKVIFRNRLDSDNPQYAKPGRGQLAHTGRASSLSIQSTGGGGGTAFFSTSWENAPSLSGGTGTPFNNLHLTDNLYITNDYAPGDAGTTGIATITSEAFVGTKALRVNYLSGFGSNGPDFRIGPYASFVGTGLTEFYLRWYQFFSTNYIFNAENKMFIWGQGGGLEQNTYYQLVGNGPTQARMQLQIPSTGVGSDPYGLWQSDNITITPGQWYRFEAHCRYGTGGVMEFRVATGNGAHTTVNFVEQSGTGFNLSNIPAAFPQSRMNAIKWDTTYNGYDNPAVQAATPFYTIIDGWTMSTAGWIGTAAP